MSSRRERPGSLEEARRRDAGALADDPPPAVIPEPPPLEEEAHWCLRCSEPGVAGPDALGNWYCARDWAAREARMAEALSARGRRPRPLPDLEPRRPTGDLAEALRRIGERLPAEGPRQQRMPYRDDDEF